MNLKRTIVSKRQNYIDEYKAAAEKVETMLKPLSQRQLNWYPSPGVWSVAQCISHMIVSGNEYKYQIEEAIKKASQERSIGEDPLRYSLVGKLFINMIEPPVKRKIKTQKFLDPAIINQKKRLIEEFSEINEELIAAVQSSENLDISRIKVVLP
ncbi:MAG: DinB family protein, partial [Clostridiales bacterium]